MFFFFIFKNRFREWTFFNNVTANSVNCLIVPSNSNYGSVSYEKSAQGRSITQALWKSLIFR